MTTPQDIIVAAMGRSTKNRPDQIATHATELLDVVGRALRGIFSLAAEVNPDYFGKEAVVAFAGAGWARPADAEAVWRIETPLGAEVVVVPRFDRQAEVGKPAVYLLGQVYRSAGNALDPVAGNLTFLYSPTAPVPALITDPLDALWPTHFDGLLIEETAMYLALKDGRADELAALAAARDTWARLFVQHLLHESTNRVYRYGTRRTFTVPSLIAAHLAPSAA